MKTWVVLPLALCQYIPAHVRAQEAVLLREFIYETAPFPECHAASLAVVPEGLVAAWFGGTEEKNDDVEIWLSRKVGGAWSEPVPVADGIVPGDRRYPCWNPVLHRDPGGRLYLYYKVGPDPVSWWGMVKTSDDGGRTWSGARRLPDGMLGPVRNKPLLVGGERLICPSSTEHDGWRIHFELTDRGGRIWRRTGPQEAGGQPAEVIQPALLRTGGDSLLALSRNRHGNIMACLSSDAGESWGTLFPIGLPNPNSGIDALTLSDSRHLLVYNHAETPAGRWGGPRSPLNLAVSEDGIHWKAALVLEDEEGAEFSYPAVVQAPDGRVHILYTWKRKRICHIELDPERLQGK
jgi:alpha-L-rhamnosidase